MPLFYFLIAFGLSTISTCAWASNCYTHLRVSMGIPFVVPDPDVDPQTASLQLVSLYYQMRAGDSDAGRRWSLQVTGHIWPTIYQIIPLAFKPEDHLQDMLLRFMEGEVSEHPETYIPFLQIKTRWASIDFVRRRFRYLSRFREISDFEANYVDGLFLADPDDIPDWRLPPADELHQREIRTLLDHYVAHFTEVEREILQARADGFSFVRIARDLNAQPDAVRIRLRRAIQRVVATYGDPF